MSNKLFKENFTEFKSKPVKEMAGFIDSQTAGIEMRINRLTENELERIRILSRENPIINAVIQGKGMDLVFMIEMLAQQADELEECMKRMLQNQAPRKIVVSKEGFERILENQNKLQN